MENYFEFFIFLSLALICATAALWGNFLFVTHQSLVGECLSHSVYPGALLGLLLAEIFSLNFDKTIYIVFISSFLFSFLSFYCISFAKKKLALSSDSSLSIVLISFFSLGMLLSCFLQKYYPFSFRVVKNLLYGQAATLSELDLIISFVIFLLSLCVIFFSYRFLLAHSFDREYAQVSGIGYNVIYRFLVPCFVSLIIAIGIKAVGVMLMSSMFIFPPLSAKRITKKFKKMIVCSVIIGAISGGGGAYLSTQISFASLYTYKKIFLPTGPTIALIASFIAMLFIIFSPKEGGVFQLWKKFSFIQKKKEENLIKVLWHCSKRGRDPFFYSEIVKTEKYKILFRKKLSFLTFGALFFRKWIKWLGFKKGLVLTKKGVRQANRLVRLHRLWELYLVSSLNFCLNKVHFFAEEIEHVITPDIEEELTNLLNDPSYDPHNELIPERE